MHLNSLINSPLSPHPELVIYVERRVKLWFIDIMIYNTLRKEGDYNNFNLLLYSIFFFKETKVFAGNSSHPLALQSFRNL